ncbi:MAG: hypothetical protein ACXWQO_05310 [Bdellovibrionota bacterium]
MLRSLQILFALLSCFGANAIAGDLTIHDSHFYDILRPNSKLECRYLSNDAFGFLLERGSDDKIHVSAITNGVNEGEKSALVVGIKAKEAIGLHLYLYERTGQYGKYVEFELLNHVSSFMNYQLPGTFMQVSAMYVPGEDGKEVENLYPDVMKRMGCRIL